MDKATLKRARQAFEQLDLSSENAEVERLEAEITEIFRAAEKATARVAEISRLLVDFAGPSGRDVADQLLRGAEAREAATACPSRDDLEGERLALQAALRELRHREADVRLEISSVEQGAAGRAAEVAGPLLAAIEADMIEAAARIKAGWAAVSAVRAAASCSGLLVDKARTAVEGVSGVQRLLPFERTVAVDPALVAALAPLATKGRALRSSSITSVAII